MKTILRTLWKWTKIAIIVILSWWLGFTWMELNCEELHGDCLTEIVYDWTPEDAEI